MVVSGGRSIWVGCPDHTYAGEGGYRLILEMIMCSCDDVGPTAYWENHPVARIEHKCCECHSPIEKGEKYQYIKGVWDGAFMTYKTCAICEKVREEAYFEGGMCICFGDLWETVGSDFEYAATTEEE